MRILFTDTSLENTKKQPPGFQQPYTSVTSGLLSIYKRKGSEKRSQSGNGISDTKLVVLFLYNSLEYSAFLLKRFLPSLHHV